jgi:hypothetical protein
MNERVDSDVRALEAPVPRAEGMPYLRFLRRMHLHLKPEWYLEIGTNKGRSLARAPGKAIAVDPAFIVNTDVVQDRPQLHMFRQTSDDFFASGVASRLAPRIDMAFLDGLHLFEFLLRDFINTEKLCSRDSVIAIHDVVPITYLAAERDWDRSRTADWTGDVWKIVPVLRAYRPDLEIIVADCAPSGLLLVTGLDPENDVLTTAYDDILSEWIDRSINDFGARALQELLDPTPARDARMTRFIGGQSVPSPAISSKPRIALRLQAPDAQKAPRWGEFHLARGLISAFNRRGYEAEIQPVDRWGDAAMPGQVDLLLWGQKREYEVPADRPTLMWLLYNARAMDDDVLQKTRHMFVASAPQADRFARTLGPDRASLLLQSFDADLMSPDGDCTAAGALFIANGLRRRVRRTVRLALEQGVEIDLYGMRWAGTEAQSFLKAEYVENTDLARHYRGAGAVLNDHRFVMGAQGFVSNRIFDALACGAPVVSDMVAGLPDDIVPWVHTYDEDAEFSIRVEAALGETTDRRAERREFARDFATRHSLDARAGDIIGILA